jgi:hypothetical protein
MTCAFALGMKKVADLPQTAPAFVALADKVKVAREAAALTNAHYLMVTDDAHLVGLLCLCDLVDKADDAPIASLVHSPFAFVTSETPAEEAGGVMLECCIGCLPVLDDGVVSGLLTRRDLRESGVLPDSPGVDRCAACEGTHDLHLNPRGGEVVFCRQCLERGRSHHDPELATTLGGFG